MSLVRTMRGVVHWTARSARLHRPRASRSPRTLDQGDKCSPPSHERRRPHAYLHIAARLPFESVKSGVSMRHAQRWHHRSQRGQVSLACGPEAVDDRQDRVEAPPFAFVRLSPSKSRKASRSMNWEISPSPRARPSHLGTSPYGTPGTGPERRAGRAALPLFPVADRLVRRVLLPGYPVPDRLPRVRVRVDLRRDLHVREDRSGLGGSRPRLRRRRPLRCRAHLPFGDLGRRHVGVHVRRNGHSGPAGRGPALSLARGIVAGGGCAPPAAGHDPSNPRPRG